MSMAFVAAELPEISVLTAPAAPVEAAWAAGLLSRQYGLSGSLRALTGERDANFLVTLDPPDSATRYMLKVSHPGELPEVADFQTQALLHIARRDPGLPVQRLVPDRTGQPSSIVAGPDGALRVVRLFSYLDGLPMPQAPRSATQSLAVIRMLARLDLALSDLRHPAGRLELPWDIQRADRVRGLLDSTDDPARRALGDRAFDAFVEIAKPLLPTLRRQPIHNDFNLYNLLAAPQATDSVAGILDFGDMVEAPLVNDLAVAIAYQLDAQGDALATMTTLAAAYHEVLPLQAAELDALPSLVRARLAMVVAISGWRAARHPDNAAYLLRNNAVSWDRLRACDDFSPARTRDALYCACGL